MSEVDFLIGQQVKELRYGHGLRIVFDLGDSVEPSLYADLGKFEYVGATNETFSIDTDVPETVAPALRLTGATVVATATADGVLLLVFSDTSSLRCYPDERYEAWQVVGGCPQWFVVCTPGGALAMWDRA